MLREQGSVPRIESLSLVEVDLALLPLTSPARDIGQRFRNLAAVRQESTRLFKVTHRCVVLFQTGIEIISLCQYGFAEIGLKRECSFSGLSRLIAEGVRWLKSKCHIIERVNVRKLRPSQSEFRIKSHGFFEIFLRGKGIGR